MYYCERCQSRFNSQRAAFIRDCPRCLLRDDVASPLVSGSPPRRDGEPAEASTATTATPAEDDTDEAFPAVSAG